MTDLAHSSNLWPTAQPCPLWRRLMAMLYDGFLLVGLWMIATVIVVIPSNQGVNPETVWFQIYLLAVAWFYFALSWRRGCTLGMKAWHIRIYRADGLIGWGRTLIRFVVAVASLGALGLGFLWSVFHPKKATWHDLATNTYLVVIPKSTSRQKIKG